ncbi:MAG: Re/Si-specific NAD(P)(+) transhydrogenase subunit alpha [Dichotomicrobium sp.]
MKVAVPAEDETEARVALTPETAKKFIKLGCAVVVEKGAGARSYFPDHQYEEAGVELAASGPEAVDGADLVLAVRPPRGEVIKAMKSGAVLAALLEPFGPRETIDALAGQGVQAFAMELMPRVTRAQAMDVLSSQANLAGYKAVVDAASAFGRAMPMMMTAAGTVPPAKVFVMGAGVAGLQAIATARRLGGVVSATDVRPAAKEQVKSLGAKFIAVEDEEFREAETAGGYAKEMSDDYKRKQNELVAEHIKSQDIVITTALIPGRSAPRLISADMVESMKPGAIILDMAAERGGNCELTRPGEDVEHNGIRIMGPVNIPGEVPGDASSLYARNLYAFSELLIDSEADAIAIDWDDEIIRGTALTRDGEVIHPVLTGETK